MLAGVAVQLLTEGTERVTIAMRDRTAEAAITAILSGTVYEECIDIMTPEKIFEAVTG